jgi:hypothetical protein
VLSPTSQTFVFEVQVQRSDLESVATPFHRFQPFLPHRPPWPGMVVIDRLTYVAGPFNPSVPESPPEPFANFPSFRPGCRQNEPIKKQLLQRERTLLVGTNVDISRRNTQSSYRQSCGSQQKPRNALSLDSPEELS